MNEPWDRMWEAELPVSQIPTEHAAQLHPWIRKLLGQSSNAIHEKLAQQWEDIRIPEVVAIRDYLLSAVPQSLVTFEGDAWLCLRKQPTAFKSKNGNDRAFYYLSPPPAQDEMHRRLNLIGFAQQPAVHEFFAHFAGMHELEPWLPSHFISPAEWEPIENVYCGGDAREKVPAEWRESFAVFHASNGDKMLLHPSGRTGWALMGPNYIPPIADTFEEMLKIYQRFQDHCESIDGYRFPKNA